MLKYILSISLVIALAGCCATNYSSQMKEILKPMQKELVAFSKKNQRYPNIDERNMLLEKLGCKISNNKCEYLGKNFLIYSETNARKSYRLKLELDNSRCYTGLFYYGVPQNVSCYQDSCFGPFKQ